MASQENDTRVLNDPPYADRTERYSGISLDERRQRPKFTCGGVGVNYTIRNGRVVFL